MKNQDFVLFKDQFVFIHHNQNIMNYLLKQEIYNMSNSKTVLSKQPNFYTDPEIQEIPVWRYICSVQKPLCSEWGTWSNWLLILKMPR